MIINRKIEFKILAKIKGISVFKVKINIEIKIKILFKVKIFCKNKIKVIIDVKFKTLCIEMKIKYKL